jgi:hypothetical protein
MKSLLGICLLSTLFFSACGGEDPSAEALEKVRPVVDQANAAMSEFVTEAKKATTADEFVAALDKLSAVWGPAGKKLKQYGMEYGLTADSNEPFDAIVDELDPLIEKRERAFEAAAEKFGDTEAFRAGFERFLEANQSWE